ncbi:MAG: hypothetical protein ACOCM4_14350 [Acetivibrio ethanolgignens]
MGDIMTFPATVEEFMEQYKMTDTEHVYSNGTEYVPIYRMKQWFEHCRNHQLLTIDAVSVVRCLECKHCDPENYHCDHPMGTAAPLRRKPDDFCSYGERKEGADND